MITIGPSNASLTVAGAGCGQKRKETGWKGEETRAAGEGADCGQKRAILVEEHHWHLTPLLGFISPLCTSKVADAHPRWPMQAVEAYLRQGNKCALLGKTSRTWNSTRNCTTQGELERIGLWITAYFPLKKESVGIDLNFKVIWTTTRWRIAQRTTWSIATSALCDLHDRESKIQIPGSWKFTSTPWPKSILLRKGGKKS